MGMDPSSEDVTFGGLVWQFTHGVLDQQNTQLIGLRTFWLHQNTLASTVLLIICATGMGRQVTCGRWQACCNVSVPVRILLLQTLELIQHGLQRSITYELNVLPSNHLMRHALH